MLFQRDVHLGFGNIMEMVQLQERQQAEEEAKMKEAELMRGNPLINVNNPGSFSVKRR
jgi:protein CWC15